MTAVQVIDRPGVVVHVANAFRPERDRSIRPVMSAQTVREWLDLNGIDEFTTPTVCLFNGAALMRTDWGTTKIGPGSVCAFVTLPHGGGGGGGGKNPLKTILSIAVMVAAPYLGAALGAAAGLSGAAFSIAGLSWGRLIGAGIAIAGTALINALIPPPKPSITAFSGGTFGAPPSPSPTYNLQAQGNSARLGQSIPSQYGRHRMFPDLIMAEPWSEYIGNDQYLYQPHCLGLGLYEVERINIAETGIENFEEITYEIVEPGRAITLFDVNVITRPEVSGQELKTGNYVGPFILNPVETRANYVGIDIVFPRGLYYANDDGELDSKTIRWVVQVRPINDEDVPTGSWARLGSQSYSASDNTAIRRSYKYSLATPGRYEIRLERTDIKDTSSRAGHEIRWAGLKAFVDGTDRFDDVTLLLVKMRATDNLSLRAARAVNVIQTRKLPVYDLNAQTWSAPQATRSPIWAACDVCKADYGAKLPDSRLPLADMAALDATLATRGDTFDGVFDAKTTVWEALTRITRCARATPILQGGIVRIVRDGPQSLPVAMFGPRNIVKGSFKVVYIMPSDDTADAVRVEFFNERTWKPAEVTAKLADSVAAKPVTVSLFGCVTSAHAAREGDYMAADNRYRRKMVTFFTEMEGLIPTYGDLIAVSHDMPRWGQGGEVEAWDDQADVLRLSEPLEWTAGQTHYIALRDRDGSLAGPYPCEAGATKTQVHLLEALALTPYTGSAQERTYFTFGPGEKWTQLCRVLAVRPRNGAEQVEITAVAEDSRVHVN